MVWCNRVVQFTAVFVHTKADNARGVRLSYSLGKYGNVLGLEEVEGILSEQMDWISTFVLFFAVIDPVGTIPIYIAMTSGLDRSSKLRVAQYATLIAVFVLCFFIFLGKWILKALNVPVSAFQIAGGAVLFLFALEMVFGESKASSVSQASGPDALHRVFFPLAVPYLAGPGAILVAIMQTEKTQHGLWEMVFTAAIACWVMGLAYVGMVFSARIFSWLGVTGAHLVSRIMGLILASLAVNSILLGLTEYFSLQRV